ncbi:MAG: RNA polymerase sigma factor [Dehalococcoidia bacterium]
MLRAFPLQSAAFGESDTDEALVAAAKADIAEFAALYERYLPRVYRYLSARAATPEEAADLTQAVFLKAYGGLGKYRTGKVPFAAWLFRIARNAAIDSHRRQKPSAPIAAAELMPSNAAHAPEAVTLQAERWSELRAAVRTLSAEKQELIALKYAAGLTAAEIAPLVGRKPEAVKKQLQRTLRELKEIYGEPE